MLRYSTETKEQLFLKSYRFLFFAKNFGKNVI